MFDDRQHLHTGLTQRLGIVVEADRDERRGVALEVEFLYKKLLTFMQIDRFRMNHPEGAGKVHLANHARLAASIRLQNNILRRGRAQRDGL